jgi:GNAT superfamily N-acetyltransferase
MISLRRAAEADAPVVAEFNARLARETESLELERARLEAGVRAVLADPGKGFYLVAERAGEVVGQLMITREWSDWRNGEFWWIQSVYVRADARNSGVFRLLYERIEAEARAAGNICGLRLYVERHNTNAQATYKKVGMAHTAYDLFETDFVLRR